jgi:hypothetical protein
MNSGNLTIKAGSKAIEILRDEGLDLGRVRVLAGASGGPKWLVLSGMDLVLARLLTGRTKELQCIGSSIGSWRLAALAQEDNQGAIRAFEKSYIHQCYDGRPTAEEVTAESRRIGEAYVSDADILFMLEHPIMRLAFVAVRSRWPGGSDAIVPQALHLLMAFTANAAHRRLLAAFYERTIIHVSGFDPEIIGDGGFRARQVELTADNFRDAALASGSIPLVMQGIRDLADAPSGTYRDGGVIDYHMNLPYSVAEDELVFMPHFFEHIVPGWFDKHLPWRKHDPKGTENMVLVAPSAAFVATLPGGKVPDRTDFERYGGRDEDRISVWKEVVRRCRVLGDELEELALLPGSKIDVQPL